MRFFLLPFCRFPRYALHPWGRLFLLMLAGGGGPALAQRSEPAPVAVIASAGNFWNVPEADRHRPNPLAMELVVFYYDGAWNLLYGQTGSEVSYLPTSGRPLPIKSGQKVRLEGTVVPAAGFDGERIHVTVLAEGMLPVPLPAGRMENLASLNGRWVQLEGYVLSQREPDATHVEAKLWVEGQFLTMTVQINATEPVPQLVGARIRAQGVCDVGWNTEGKVEKIEVWAPVRDRIEVTGWLAEDERFALPRTLIERLESASVQPWVRLAGEVIHHETGGMLILRDETGQIEIATAQPEALPAGTAVEVIGSAEPGPSGWTLQRPLFRRLDEAPGYLGRRPGDGGAPLRLRLAEQVLQLTAAEAERRQPVTLRGVVTWSDQTTGRFYLQDASGGIAIRRGAGELPDFGTSVTVTGVTARGAPHAEVEMTDGVTAGSLALPPPRRITLEQALTGSEEGRWVEMGGFVRQVVGLNGRTRLELTAHTGEFFAELPGDSSLAEFQGAILRVRGVCETQTGANGEIVGVRLLVQGREGLRVDVSGATDPFAVGLQTIAGLREASVMAPVNQRVRVRGAVSLHQPGRYLYLQDGAAGLFVLTRETKTVAPGTWIELVGLPGRAGNRLAMREGLWREAPVGAPIEPHALAAAEPVDTGLDLRLVRLPVVLRQTVRTEAGWQLSGESGGRIIESTLRAAPEWQPPATGSLLELTGVYVVEFDEYRQPHSIRLELREAGDIRLLARPSWWNVRRTLFVAGGLGVLVLLFFSWGIALRRQVAAQTERIRRQAEQEKRLQTELERAARLESLGVLAGGIAHDFNNLLTAILGNLGLAAMDKRVMAAAGDCIAEAERGARRARDITQQLLTFAKGGDPVRAAVLLPEIVTEAANFARHGSNVRFDCDFPSDLPPGNVDAGQISRVVHNLVLNAVQAMPDGGVVTLSLAAVQLAPGQVDLLEPGAYLRLTIADTGRGIPAENLALIFDPYFSTKSKTGNSGLGLATVRSIIKKHHGHIEVESQVGRGTTFRLWLPVAPAETPAAASAGQSASAQPSARILVMDDEEVIRRVAGRMLSLAGHEVVYAAEGAEAVRVYASARQTTRPIDLVIFDLTVPGGMGGKEALQELMKIDPGVRAIASSGYSGDPVMSQPRTFGFRASLPKPYDIPDLLRVVAEARRH